MSLLIATRDGVYRATELPFEEPERVLDSGHTPRVRTFDGVDGVYATSKTGLYHSADGESWTDLGVPGGDEEVWEVLHHDGDLYVGTYPAGLYRSPDGGETWTELAGIQSVPDRDRWRNPFGPDGRIRTLATPPDRPERLLLGVEAGGFFVTDDRGQTWTERDVAGQHDFHRVIAPGPREYFVAVGRLSVTNRNHGAKLGGLFHTVDGGDTFERVGEPTGPTYFRDVLYHEDTLYACGAFTLPPEWLGGFGADAHLFESTDRGPLVEKPYPGGPDEIVLALGVHDGAVVGGTSAGGVVGPGDADGGRVIRREDDGTWADCGRLPADVHSLESVSR